MRDTVLVYTLQIKFFFFKVSATFLSSVLLITVLMKVKHFFLEFLRVFLSSNFADFLWILCHQQPKWGVIMYYSTLSEPVWIQLDIIPWDPCLWIYKQRTGHWYPGMLRDYFILSRVVKWPFACFLFHSFIVLVSKELFGH